MNSCKVDFSFSNAQITGNPPFLTFALMEFLSTEFKVWQACKVTEQLLPKKNMGFKSLVLQKAELDVLHIWEHLMFMPCRLDGPIFLNYFLIAEEEKIHDGGKVAQA